MNDCVNTFYQPSENAEESDESRRDEEIISRDSFKNMKEKSLEKSKTTRDPPLQLHERSVSSIPNSFPSTANPSFHHQSSFAFCSRGLVERGEPGFVAFYVEHRQSAKLRSEGNAPFPSNRFLLADGRRSLLV